MPPEPRTHAEMHSRVIAARDRMFAAGIPAAEQARAIPARPSGAARLEALERAIHQLTLKVAGLVDEIDDLRLKEKAEVVHEGPNVRSMAGLVASVTGVSLPEMVADSRTKGPTKARVLLYWLCVRFTPSSSTGIGRAIGDRDHTTVLNGVKRVNHVIAVRRVEPAEDTPIEWARALWATPWPYAEAGR